MKTIACKIFFSCFESSFFFHNQMSGQIHESVKKCCQPGFGIHQLEAAIRDRLAWNTLWSVIPNCSCMSISDNSSSQTIKNHYKSNSLIATLHPCQRLQGRLLSKTNVAQLEVLCKSGLRLHDCQKLASLKT